MDLLRSSHFKKYIEDKTTLCWKTVGGVSDAVARTKFQDSFYEDFNTMKYVLDTVFPNTKFNGEDYEFITNKVNIKDIQYDKFYEVGRMYVTIPDTKARIIYKDTKFRHGSIYDHGTIHCYGNYKPFDQNVIKIGFSGALLDTYSFGCVTKENKFDGVQFKEVQRETAAI